ncbi:MAG: protein translocase subunit SecD, partial [Candidatus Liptonbacteria bacterium]|nr:protein translocase subunit SecD [Candidatus Liptonbacteria bacterium]
TVESATGTITGFLATELTGRYVTGARLDFDSVTRAPEVAVTFNEEGARIFEELTGRLVGEPLAILLDGVPISIPVVQQKISGGSAVITGDFTVPEARELVGRFNAGALPAPITLVAQQTVSATLGSDLLEKAVIAGAWGTLLVMAFMVVYYRMLGVFASLALIIYIPLTLAVFKLVPVTMTLAGVAGFVLTVGMAVDANILIFERMKEEMRKGLSRASAIEEGFRRAWLSIRDSNVTTALTALILYYFTSSFIQGFALTLFLGVLVSMFSALTVTRTLLRVFTRKV